jgi:hypothetical protein
MQLFNFNDEEYFQENGLKPEKWMIDAIEMNYGYCLWDQGCGSSGTDSKSTTKQRD